MFRNWFSAAWGDLKRSPVQSFIAIGGLAIGLMAAIIAGVVTVDAFSRDHFIPGHERLYFAVMEAHGFMGDRYQTQTGYNVADYIRPMPGVTGLARIASRIAVVRKDSIVTRDAMAWADPDLFRIYPAPTLYGDAGGALDRPDGLVITLGAARKYFGRDDVVGEKLQLDHVPFTVRAVIADWPANQGEFKSTLFCSSLSPASPMNRDKGKQGLSRDGGLMGDMTMMVQLAPGASREVLDRAAASLMTGFVPPGMGFTRSMHFERLDELNMSSRLHPDNRAHLYVMEVVTLVILTLSIINFINLSVARSTQRGLEVAIRKAVGAARRALIVQFLGEAILQTLFALFVAVMLVELALPAVDDFLESGAVFDYWRNPLLDVAMLGGAVLVGAVAGAYPAFILSAFRPAAVLKGRRRGTARGAWARQGFVALQFAALIVFLVAAATAFRQNQFATRDALRVNIDQTVMIAMPKCDDAFRERLLSLPGVKSAGCANRPDYFSSQEIELPAGGKFLISMEQVGYGFLNMLDLKPLAGRLFRAGSGDEAAGAGAPLRYIINESALRQLHFASPAAAIGRNLRFPPIPASAGQPAQPNFRDGIIVGVIRDFSLNPEAMAKTTGDTRIAATAYALGTTTRDNLTPPPVDLFVKLDGHDVPESLAAIDQAWTAAGYSDPINRQFLDAFVQSEQQTVLREGEAFSVFAGIAMLLACLGLFGVSLLTASRRIKEIGVRKAMGASRGAILMLMLMQFAAPVLWANLIAWPVAWWAMQSWLNGFVFHVDLNLWLFPAAGVVALFIALLAVGGQALVSARQRPVLALRYE